jgi:hypothetical protein
VLHANAVLTPRRREPPAGCGTARRLSHIPYSCSASVPASGGSQGQSLSVMAGTPARATDAPAPQAYRATKLASIRPGSVTTAGCSEATSSSSSAGGKYPAYW